MMKMVQTLTLEVHIVDFVDTEDEEMGATAGMTGYSILLCHLTLEPDLCR